MTPLRSCSFDHSTALAVASSMPRDRLIPGLTQPEQGDNRANSVAFIPRSKRLIGRGSRVGGRLLFRTAHKSSSTSWCYVSSACILASNGVICLAAFQGSWLTVAMSPPASFHVFHIPTGLPFSCHCSLHFAPFM